MTGVWRLMKTGVMVVEEGRPSMEARFRVSGLAAGVFAALLLTGCPGSDNGMLRVTGQIEGNAVTAGSRVGGRVVEVLVEEGAWVEQGAPLLRLEDDEAQALVAAAEAQVARAAALLAKLEAGVTAEQMAQAEAAARAAEEQYLMAQRGARDEEIGAAEAQAAAARAQRDAARTEFDRAKRLLGEGAISQQKYDQAETLLRTAGAQLDAALETLTMAKDGARVEEIGMAKANYERAQAVVAELREGAREEDLASGRAAVEAAKAERDRARAALREMTVTAPIGGLVEAVDVLPGDLIKPGPAVRLVDPDDLELTVYVSAGYLGHLRLGQQVTLTTDSHGGTTFEATIAHIASQGEFTPRNLQTQEERMEQAFAVKLDLDSADGRLRSGMTAIVSIPKPDLSLSLIHI